MQLAKSWKIAQTAQLNRLFSTFDTNCICFCIYSNSFYRLTCSVISKKWCQQRLVYKLSDERFADSLLFFISMSYMYSISLRCLFLEELNQLFNACAIEDHFTFLGKSQFVQENIELVKTKKHFQKVGPWVTQYLTL